MIAVENNNLVRIPQKNSIKFINNIQDNYSFTILSFTRWLTDNGQDISFKSIHDYFASLNTSDYSAATINFKRAAVKNRIKALHDQGQFNVEEAMKVDRALSQLDRDPKTKARKINTRQVGRDKIINEDEYTLLIENASSERHRVVMQFLWATGCRIAELTGIKTASCKPAGKYISIRILGKGDKERYIKITPELFEEIKQTFDSRTWLFGTSNDKAYTRNYLSGEITKLGKKVLNRQISAHTFRHAWFTRMIRETGKIKAVSVYGGHASVKTTMDLYVHEELTDEELFS